VNVERNLKRLSSAAATDRSSREAARDLAARASEAGLVDVAVATMDSPIGELTVAVTPRGLVTIAFAGEDRDVLFERLARELSPRVLEVPGPTDGARREIEEYFAGERRRFELKVDRSLIGPFARKVLRATSRVGYGRLATYGEIAKRIERPKAARAVGSALGSNPIPIVIPCHRIVGVNGKLTGYAGGLARKETLLRLEGSLLLA
jgi:methylated-DNA-[protein]-cysteine S-methyltransferase